MGSKGTRLLAAAWVAALFGGLLALEAISALGAESCATATQGERCYPWGAEGPSAGLWNYQSKAHYVFAGLLPLTAAGLVLVGLIRHRDELDDLPRWKALVVLTIVAAPFALPTLMSLIGAD